MSAAVSLGRDYRSILDQKIATGSRSAAEVIETIHRDAPTDQIAKATSFRFRQADAFGVEIADRETTWGYSISDHALNQAAERAGIPAAYVRDLARTAGDQETWKPELAAQILNQHFAHSEGRILARSVRGQLRGVLSDRYRRLDSRPLVDALATEAQAVGAIPIDGIATETRVALKVILPDTFEPIPGEIMALGAEWSNSDFGNGTHSIRAFALRVVCLNGMTRENLMRQIHLGGRLHDSIEYSDRTHRLDTATSVSALKDVVRGALGPKGVEDLMTQIRMSHEKKMEGGALKASLRALPKADVKTIVDAFESKDVINLPPGNTAWRASNAVSWVARHTEDAEKRIDMERIAGSLV